MLASGSFPFAVAVVLIGLAGCGQKGPLKLPTTPAASPAASGPAVAR